jgi:hypothetical protein
MLPVDLQGLGKWELIYFGNLQRQQGQSSIEPLELPFLAENRYLTVGAGSTTARPTWIRAGYMIQFLENINVDNRVIFPGSGNPGNTADAGTRLIKLNQIQIVTFPKLANSYRLFFQPVRWLTQLNLAVWQFTGTEIDVLELITQINNKLDNQQNS